MDDKQQIIDQAKKLFEAMQNLGISIEDITSTTSDNTEPPKQDESSNNDDNVHHIRRRGSGRRKAKRHNPENNRKGKGKKRQNKEKACRVEPIYIGERDNKFNIEHTISSLDESERVELKNVDKIKEKKRVSIGKRSSGLISIVCSECDYEFDVPKNTVFNEKRWKCNDCITGGK